MTLPLANAEGVREFACMQAYIPEDIKVQCFKKGSKGEGGRNESS